MDNHNPYAYKHARFEKRATIVALLIAGVVVWAIVAAVAVGLYIAGVAAGAWSAV